MLRRVELQRAVEPTDDALFRGGPLVAAVKVDAAAWFAVVDAMPPHHCYVAMDSAVPLLLARVPSPIEVVNDAEGHVRNFFETLRTPELLHEFSAYCRLFNEDERVSLGQLAESVRLDGSPAERAYVWFRVAKALFLHAQNARLGLFGKPPRLRLWPARERALRLFYGFLESIDECLPDLHGRLLRIQYECRDDAAKMVELYDAPDTVFCAYQPDIETVKLLTTAQGQAVVVGA